MPDPEYDAVRACPDCDALQAVNHAKAEGRSFCVRCGSELQEGRDDRLDRIFPLAVASMTVYLIANLAPLVRLNLQGDAVSTTLFGAAAALWAANMEPISVLVLITTVVLPGVYLGAILYLVGGVLWMERGPNPRRLPYAQPVLRIAQLAQSWSMIEVFLISALVAIVRLAPVGTVSVGSALWGVAGLVLMLATLASAFHPRLLWRRLDLLESR
ncbi:MAG: paraquat-inducible protein A [Burkholderiaceae bacterium]|jgi:paraquat-inducible protein A